MENRCFDLIVERTGDDVYLSLPNGERLQLRRNRTPVSRNVNGVRVVAWRTKELFHAEFYLPDGDMLLEYIVDLPAPGGQHTYTFNPNREDAV